MPLLPDRQTPGTLGVTRQWRRPPFGRRDHREVRGPIEIGLVNNMPDAALRATERQFAGLLAAAARGRHIRLRLIALPEIPRGEAAAAHIAAGYINLDEAMRRPLDGLIVTGKEPRAPALSAEPYWKSFTALVDWAGLNTISTIWSCLAAHAAVLHLDGVERHLLSGKRFGVFDCAKSAAHPLLAGTPPLLRVSHSRHNDLREEELVAKGYRVLARSREAGVDMFARDGDSLFVFFQGHPEYDADSLAREYRRDVGRFLKGETKTYPALPVAYFDGRTTEALAAFEASARAGGGPNPMSAFPADLAIRRELAEGWHASAVPLLRNWLAFIAKSRAGKARS